MGMLRYDLYSLINMFPLAVCPHSVPMVFCFATTKGNHCKTNDKIQLERKFWKMKMTMKMCGLKKYHHKQMWRFKAAFTTLLSFFAVS